MINNKKIVLNLIIFLVAGVILTSVLTIIITKIVGFGLNTEIADDIIWGLAFYTLPSILISSIIFYVASLKIVEPISVVSYSLIYSIAYLVSLSAPFFIVKLSNSLSGSIGDLGFIILLWGSLPLITSVLFIFGIIIFKKILKK